MSQLATTAPSSALPVQPAGGQRLTYLYLVSAAHSGSTLLGCLLGAHPQISTVGEFGAVFPLGWDMRCSCGETLGNCSFWQSWRAEADREGLEFNPGALGVNVLDSAFQSFWDRLYLHLFPHPAVDRLRNLLYGRRSPQRRKAEAAIDKSIRLASALCKLEGTNAFLDTTKAGQLVPLLAARPEIDFKFISLVRDGRGVMKSLMEKENFSPAGAIDAFLWSNKHRLRAEAYAPPDRIYRVRLEDFCAAPEEQLRNLKAFAGVDPDAPVDYATSNRHIMGNLMRLKFDGTIRRDESWRTYLTKDQLDQFAARAGRMNRGLGYDD